MNTMLPALPKTFGRLSDIFVSSLGSITGEDNRLDLQKASRVCTVLVDGLGSQNLVNAAGHARFLNGKLGSSAKASCGFPSTTAASISSFSTGLQPGEHGIVGYQVINPQTNQIVNLLSGWGQNLDPLKWQPNETVSERALKAGVRSIVVGPGVYQGSGFTQATMRGSEYLSASSLQDRFDVALEALNGKEDALIYLYVPELDQIAHSLGVNSSEWLHKLEELDSVAQSAAKQVSTKASLFLTADHGVIDIDSSRHIFLDEFDHLMPELKLVGGDPRVNYLYFDSEGSQQLTVLRQRLQESLGKSVVVADVDQLIEAGWFGPVVSSVAKSRMPQLFVIARTEVAIYHRRFAATKSLEMIGQHGSLSSAETAIPFLDLRRTN